MIERLRELIGGDAVSEGGSSPFRVHGRPPVAVAAPSTAEQAAAVLRVCSENGWAVEAAGSGTWLDWGRPPARVDVVLSAERLAGVIAYEPADLVITVAAGTPLAEVAETVTADRQMLGLDPPARPGATVGATIALASAGPLRLSLGTPRDHVLGLELVTGDGRVVRLGGRVVKNVAGYDLVRLAVGSWGTLGFITRAHLRLRPAFDAEVTALFHAAEPGPLIGLAHGPASGTWPAAMELLAPPTSTALGQGGHWTLAVRCRGNEAFVAEATRRLGRLVEGVEPDILAEHEAARFWDALATLEARSILTVRYASLPNRLADLVELARWAAFPEHAPDPGKGWSDNDSGWFLCAHAGSGIARLWRTEPPAGDRVNALGSAIDEARNQVGPDGGTVTVPMMPGAAAAIDPFGHPAPLVEIMRGLKRVFDPAGILSAGRFPV